MEVIKMGRRPYQRKQRQSAALHYIEQDLMTLQYVHVAENLSIATYNTGALQYNSSKIIT